MNPDFQLAINQMAIKNFDQTAGRRNRSRKGVAMLELAIVLPILLLLVFGIIEMGRVMMLNQMATNACREACRQAIVPGMDHDKVIEIVDGYLDVSGVSQTGRVITMRDGQGNVVENLKEIGSHEEVVVEVQFPYANNTWGITFITGAGSLVARSNMRRE